MQKNMKTSVHQAKFGKPPRMADIMELTKAMIHASYTRLALSLTQPLSGAALTTPMEMVASANGSPIMRPMLKVDLWP